MARDGSDQYGEVVSRTGRRPQLTVDFQRLTPGERLQLKIGLRMAPRRQPAAMFIQSSPRRLSVLAGFSGILDVVIFESEATLG